MKINFIQPTEHGNFQQRVHVTCSQHCNTQAIMRRKASLCAIINTAVTLCCNLAAELTHLALH